MKKAGEKAAAANKEKQAKMAAAKKGGAKPAAKGAAAATPKAKAAPGKPPRVYTARERMQMTTAIRETEANRQQLYQACDGPTQAEGAAEGSTTNAFRALQHELA